MNNLSSCPSGGLLIIPNYTTQRLPNSFSEEARFLGIVWRIQHVSQIYHDTGKRRRVLKKEIRKGERSWKCTINERGNICRVARTYFT